MPEASLDLDDGAVFWQNDVGTARKVRDMKAIAKTEPVKRSPQREFGSGIPAFYARHHP
jgi:hypothetical protein